MTNWYKKSQTVDLAQDWIHRMERTFELYDFGRVKFRSKRFGAADRTGRFILTFSSQSDPTLPQYAVRVAYNPQKGLVDYAIFENNQPKLVLNMPVNEQTLAQSPIQIAEQVKRFIIEESNYGGQETRPDDLAGRIRNRPSLEGQHPS